MSDHSFIPHPSSLIPSATLARLVEPCAPEEFLGASWGRAPRYVRGRAGKFAALMPWPRLAEILSRHRLEPPRLRLTREGKSVSPSAYLRQTTNARSKSSVPRLRPAELTNLLRDGATLVLDAVDELHQPLTALAADLELLFREHVQINLYAGWRTSHGFDLHWDDHDVFILQVAGRKRWRVYGMTRPYPVANDSEPAPKPTGEPVWEGTLEDGDLLYIPRGFWHVAFPLDEPTLHLTVGIHKRNGLDLLRWLADQLRASEAFRRDLPRDASAGEQAAHVERLRRELLERFDGEALKNFFRDQDTNAAPRPRLSFPLAAAKDFPQPPLDSVVALTSPRPIEFEVRGDEVSFAANRKLWRFDARALEVLRPLEERRACAVAELREAAREVLDERTVRALVGELILHGLVAIVEE